MGRIIPAIGIVGRQTDVTEEQVTKDVYRISRVGTTDLGSSYLFSSNRCCGRFTPLVYGTDWGG